ncbi:hypothetical protein GF312_05765 [Candidatus Poribacteria bacterium]|nr:hypothetical protein [Candidatus Poribacteria bacterium]
MKELFTMWKNTRMIVLTAVTASIYAAVLIPFKVAIPLVPGFTEVRPANVVPIVCSLMFGPAAAWGAAIGNTIGDFFGTFGLGTIFGFIGNFLYGYIPYRMWKAFGSGEPVTPRRRSFSTALVVALVVLAVVLLLPPAVRTLRDGSAYKIDLSSKPVLFGIFLVTPVSFLAALFMTLPYLLVTISASLACGIMIGWGVHILGLVPFPALGNIIVLNNLLVSIVLGPILLPALYPVVKRLGLIYSEVMDEQDQAKARRWASALMVIAVISALIVGNWVSIGGYDMGVMGDGFGPVVGQGGVGLALTPFILLILIAAAAM